MNTVPVPRSALTPAMRQAVAIAQPGQDLRGLFHGATPNALVRHGLARRERGWGAEENWVVVLTGLGEIVRDELEGWIPDLEEKSSALREAVDAMANAQETIGACPL